jgi:endoglucanase
MKRALAFLLLLLAAPAASQPAEPSAAIRLNQLGLLPDGPKRALLPDPATAPLRWQLLDAAGAEQASGQTQVLGNDPASGEHLHLIDFSTFAGTGEGYSLVVGEARSRPFAITADLYRRLPFDALAYFYHNRSGIPIEARFAGGERWARPAGHMPDRATCISGPDRAGNRWTGCAYTLDASRGWYDAGDHGKYVVNGGIAVWTLLNAWERRHTIFPDGSAAIPEAGNGVDDLLDEARWEMEFLLAMQVPEGARLRVPVGARRGTGRLTFTEIDASGMAHHKLADQRWTALPMAPHRDPQTRFLYPPSTAATLNLAATAAQCARVWRTIDPAFSRRCLAAARRAFAAALRNPNVSAVDDFDGSGGYGDTDVSDEFYWAAAELDLTTREETYRARVAASPFYTQVPGEPGWQSTATLGTISLALAGGDREWTDARQLLVRAADAFLADEARSGYRIPYAPQGFTWGSNSNLLNRAIILALAYDFTREARYRAGVIDAMDYLLGRNPLDRSFISGYGARPMQNPHHRFWSHSLDPAFPPPPPGVLSGGPNNIAMADDVARPLRGHCAPMLCWRDDIHAFSLNEVAVNWNAPLVWVSAWLADAR